MNEIQSFACRPIEAHDDSLALIAHLLQIDYRGFQSGDACQQIAGMRVSRSNSGLLKELLQLPGTIESAQRPPRALDHVGRTIVLDKVVDDACRHGRGDMTIVRTVGINKIVCCEFVAREIERAPAHFFLMIAQELIKSRAHNRLRALLAVNADTGRKVTPRGTGETVNMI